MQRLGGVAALLLLVGAANAAPALDVSGVQAKLQSMLAGSQQRLQLVEEKNAEVVKKIKDEAGKDLSDEAETLGNVINDYAKTLTTSEAALKAAKKAGQEAIDAYNKEAKPGEATSSLIDGKASLMAKLSVADRTLRRAKSRREAAVSRADGDASGRLDDEAMRLGTKLGDLTKWLDPAKEKLSEVDEPAKEDPDEVAAAAAEAAKHPQLMQEDDPDAALMDVMQKDGYSVATTTAAPKPKAAAKPAAKVVEKKKPDPPAKKKSFKELANDLDKATKQETAAVKTANGNLRAAFAKDEKASASKMEKLEKDLTEQRKKLTQEAKGF